jgi:hypothetical protein
MVRILLTFALIVACPASLLAGGGCSQIFQRGHVQHGHHVQQLAYAHHANHVVTPLVLYTVGAGLQAEVFAEQLAPLVAKELQKQAAAVTPAPIAKPSGSMLAAKCARCHGGATPAAELTFDGDTFVPDRSFRRWIEMAYHNKSVPEEMVDALSRLTPEEKGAITDELLILKPTN